MSTPPFELAAPRGRLLLLEDSSVLRALLLLLLHRAGYQTTAYETLEDAEAAVKRETFDAIVLNSDRPGIERADFLALMNANASRGVIFMVWRPSPTTTSTLQKRGITVILDRTTDPVTMLRHIEAQFSPAVALAPAGVTLDTDLEPSDFSSASTATKASAEPVSVT